MRENVNIRDKSPPPKDLPKVEPYPEGIRIRGIPEFDSEKARDYNEQGMQEVLKVLNHLEVKAQVVDLKRFGTFRSERSRTIVMKVSNVWEKRLILSSIAQLRSFERQVLVSRELTPSEPWIELEPLKCRKKLIDEGADPGNLRIKDLKRCQKKNDRWMEVEAQSTEASN